MRAWTVSYAGLADAPSRTITGEVLVTASSLHTAAARAVQEIDKREGRGKTRTARIRSITLRIHRGSTVDRAVADRLDAAAEVATA